MSLETGVVGARGPNFDAEGGNMEGGRDPILDAGGPEIGVLGPEPFDVGVILGASDTDPGGTKVEAVG